MPETFSFASSRNFGIPLIALVVGLLPLLISAYFFYTPGSIRFEVDDHELRIRGDAFYGRAIPLETLAPFDARVVDLSRESGLKPAMRTNGTGLPGFQSGWFRLANGEKALVFLGDRTRVITIPVPKESYRLLLSVEQPERLLGRLKQIAVLSR